MLDLMHPYTTSMLSEGVFLFNNLERHAHGLQKRLITGIFRKTCAKMGKMPIKPQTGDTSVAVSLLWKAV